MENTKCSECGLVHPYTPPGQCPIAKEQSLKAEVASTQNQKLVSLFQAIQLKLIEKLRDKPEDYQTAVATEIFKYIEKLP